MKGNLPFGSNTNTENKR